MPTINNLPSLTTATGQMLFPIVDVTVNPNVTKKATLDVFNQYVSYRAPIGFTGSIGYAGSRGFIGSQGIQGYTGSASTTPGYVGSAGTGFVGSIGSTGYVGSAGVGYTGSIGSGYTGSAGGGGGAVSRVNQLVTTPILPVNSSTTVTITGFKSYALLSINVSNAAWVTVYTSTASMYSDTTRSISTDPMPGSGVIAEVITTTPGWNYFTPAVIGFSTEYPITTNIPVKIYNNSTTASTITVRLTLLQLEA